MAPSVTATASSGKVVAARATATAATASSGQVAAKAASSGEVARMEVGRPGGYGCYKGGSCVDSWADWTWTQACSDSWRWATPCGGGLGALGGGSGGLREQSDAKLVLGLKKALRAIERLAVYSCE